MRAHSAPPLPFWERGLGGEGGAAVDSIILPARAGEHEGADSQSEEHNP